MSQSALKCCKKTWIVASDDFVLPSIVGMIIHTVWLGGLIAFALVVLVGRDCFPEGPRKKIVFAFIYSQIGSQVLVIISEGLVGFVSSRGTISNSRPRHCLPHFLRLRAVLYFMEVLGCAFGCYVTWSPYIQDHIDCERDNRVRQAIKAYVISVIVVLALNAILFMIRFDPLGLQTPSLLKELGHIHLIRSVEVESNDTAKHENRKKDNKRKYNGLDSAQQRWSRRVKMLCCCAGHSNRKAQAMKQIAHTLASLTYRLKDFVPTYYLAGLLLVKREQKNNKLNNDSETRLKCVNTKDIRFLQDIRHYLKFALGIYGWPIHVYLNPLFGSLCLCAHIKCGLFHKRAKDFVNDNCCLANTTAFQLRSKSTVDHIICASYINEDQLPYSLCYDHRRAAIVLSIRGTMSLRDVLIDLDMAMEDITIDDVNYCNLETKVHGGMYKVAKNIRNDIDKILKAALNDYNYEFVITGHSLGGGVAAILAVLYRKEIPKLHCYAYSPPGCLFTQPLVEYSKSFITTIVYGNDLVPRLTICSLKDLVRRMSILTEHSNIPKHAILCPNLFCCCYRPHHNVSDPGLQNNESSGCSTEAGTSKNEHYLQEERSGEDQTPAYAPGNVILIRKTEKRIHRRLWNIIGQKEVEVVCMPNEGLSHIIVADGMFDHHMPDILQEVIEHLYRQQVEGMGLKIATLDDPIKLYTNYDDKKESGQLTQFFHNGVVFSALSDINQQQLHYDDKTESGQLTQSFHNDVVFSALSDMNRQQLYYDDKTESGQLTQFFHNGVVFSALSDMNRQQLYI